MEQKNSRTTRKSIYASSQLPVLVPGLQVARIRMEEHLVDVYGADGWRGAR